MSDDAERFASQTRSSPVRARREADEPAAATAREGLVRGTMLGRLVLLEHRGDGGMGVVYAAYDPELDRRVAVKLLHPGHGERAREREARLLREARAMARLAHPNIVTVYDAGVLEGQVFLSMELVEGVTLRAWLATQRRGWREALAVCLHAGRGLAAAHEAGLVHRDFKPENVLVGVDGRVRVADFGLARDALGEDDEPPPRAAPLEGPTHPAPYTDAELTRAGALLGTPAYMAPEQLSGARADARADQFAFCVVLYEALYQERPFRADSLSAQREAIARGPARPRDERGVPSWLRDVLLRGLRAEPTERYPSMRALLDALPRDPEADPRVSHRARAALVGALVSLQFVVGSIVDPPRSSTALSEAQRTPIDGRTTLAWVAVTLLLFSVLAWVFRARLFANRVSRQLVASLAALYYGSIFANYGAGRLGVSDAAASTLALVWGGVCTVLLGIALHRVFLAVGALSLAAGALSMALPREAPLVARAATTLMALLLVVAWGRRVSPR